MPKLLVARPPVDGVEERQVRTVAGSRHAPGDGIRRAQRIVRSGAGLRTTVSARELGCHPQTVRERLTRCNAAGVRWRGVPTWAESNDPDFVPKGRPSLRAPPRRPRTAR